MTRHPKPCTFCAKGTGYRLKKYLALLKKLAFGSGKVRRNIVNKADPCFIKLLRECVLNFLHKKVDVMKDDDNDTKKNKQKRLRRYIPTLVHLAQPKTSHRKSQQLLQQKGGFLPIILPAIISLVTGIAGETIGQALK
jgi:hypothetical protein